MIFKRKCVFSSVARNRKAMIENGKTLYYRDMLKKWSKAGIENPDDFLRFRKLFVTVTGNPYVTMTRAASRHDFNQRSTRFLLSPPDAVRALFRIMGCHWWRVSGSQDEYGQVAARKNASNIADVRLILRGWNTNHFVAQRAILNT